MTTMQIAWLVYALGGLGCCIAAWWMFLWTWRLLRYAIVITVITILFTPYAIDPQTMQLAPAVYSLIFNGMALGADVIMPLVKLMLGIWAFGIVLASIYVMLTRHPVKKPTKVKQSHSVAKSPQKIPKKNLRPQQSARKKAGVFDNLSHEEREARDELLQGSRPMHAIRD